MFIWSAHRMLGFISVIDKGLSMGSACSDITSLRLYLKAVRKWGIHAYFLMLRWFTILGTNLCIPSKEHNIEFTILPLDTSSSFVIPINTRIHSSSHLKQEKHPSRDIKHGSWKNVIASQDSYSEGTEIRNLCNPSNLISELSVVSSLSLITFLMFLILARIVSLHLKAVILEGRKWEI